MEYLNHNTPYTTYSSIDVRRAGWRDAHTTSTEAFSLLDTYCFDTYLETRSWMYIDQILWEAG